MNDKGRHVSVPQPLPANFGPPVLPVGPGPGQGPGQQQPWGPYHMTHQGYPKNPDYPMHPAGYMPRYPGGQYDAQCQQGFPFGGKNNPPNAYPIVRHYNAQHYSEKDNNPQQHYNNAGKDNYNDVPKDGKYGGKSSSSNKSPSQAKEKNGRHDNNDLLSSDSKSDSETNHTTTESCPEDDTRSPASCDKSFFGDKSDSNSHLESKSRPGNNNLDSNSVESFSSVSNSHEMRVHPPYPHGYPGMFQDGERRMQHVVAHPMGDGLGYKDENVFQVKGNI